MASAILRGKIWYAQYKNADGKKVREATKARGKRECLRIATELEDKYWRQRRGLEEREAPFHEMSVPDVVQWYADHKLKGKPSQEVCRDAIRLHIRPALSDVKLGKLTTPRVEGFLEEMEDKELSPQMVNHLRGYIVRAINAAVRLGKWAGANAAAAAQSRHVAERDLDQIEAHEVLPFIQGFRDQGKIWWERWWAVRLYAGLRRGEAAALRPEDVDLELKTIKVRRSYDRKTTKGRHADTIPFPDELLPYLEVLVEEAKGGLLFRTAGGKPIGRDFKEVGVFRSGLVRAGIVTGYTHKCRRKGCGHSEVHRDDKIRRCPEIREGGQVCGYKLWPVGNPRPIRPYDTRGTFGSLLYQAGVPLDRVAELLRHRDPRTTRRFYARLKAHNLREDVNRLRFGSALESPRNDSPAETRQSDPAAKVDSGEDRAEKGAPRGVKKRGPNGVQAEAQRPDPSPDPASFSGAGEGTRTLDPQLGKGKPDHRTKSDASDPCFFSRGEEGSFPASAAGRDASQALGSKWGPSLLPAPGSFEGLVGRAIFGAVETFNPAPVARLAGTYGATNEGGAGGAR